MRSKNGVFTCVQCFLTSQSNSSIIRAELLMFAVFIEVTTSIRIPCLPIEYYDKKFMMQLGAKVGRPVRVDEAISLVSRVHFMRICVEVDLSKPLLSKFKL